MHFCRLQLLQIFIRSTYYHCSHPWHCVPSSRRLPPTSLRPQLIVSILTSHAIFLLQEEFGNGGLRNTNTTTPTTTPNSPTTCISVSGRPSGRLFYSLSVLPLVLLADATNAEKEKSYQ
ncbi:hypothetical protein PM082_003304 [Marasmius tenuissimus]|nr:hypothetical protein PM082_003304 [Marasmius tenuissimus]